jgi:hypothetical protein
MTARMKDPTPATPCPSPLVLFGIDSRGKPKGARFGKQHAGLAVKAAGKLQLHVLASNDPNVAEIAARLPVGRVHATGRTFVPFIRRDLYDKLVAAAANGTNHPTPPPNGASSTSGSTPGGSAPHLPRSWQEIGLGDLVVANQDRWEGWYEAIVVHVDGDMLTLRWRDYPRERKLCAIGCGWGCVIPARNQRQTPASRLKPRPRENMRKRSRQIPPPTAIACPKVGMRSTSIILCWPKTTANGQLGGKRSRLRKPATVSSSAGATTRPTCRLSRGHGSTWR